jgi:cellulose biosynthesis protein BcsQ
VTILAIYSNKGGVGKTVAAVNLAYLAAQSGKKTLICDLDPQSSTTYFFRVRPKVKPKARGFDRGGKRIKSSIKGTDFYHLDLLPADFTHRNLDIGFGRLQRSKHQIRRILKPLESEYDLIVLDCLPTINIIAENIFNASDFLLVPITPSTLAIRTQRQFFKFLRDNRYDMDTVLTFLSMVNQHKRSHNEYSNQIRDEFEGVLKCEIPYLTLVERMGLERQPLPAFAPISAAANAYSNLWNEVQERIF